LIGWNGNTSPKNLETCERRCQSTICCFGNRRQPCNDNQYPKTGKAEQNGEPDHYLYNSDDMHKCLHGDRIVLKDAVNCMIWTWSTATCHLRWSPPARAWRCWSAPLRPLSANKPERISSRIDCSWGLRKPSARRWAMPAIPCLNAFRLFGGPDLPRMPAMPQE